MKFKLEIEGLDEIKKLLKSLPDEVNDKIKYDVHRAGARLVKKQLEDSTPSGNNTKSSSAKAENNVAIAKQKGTRNGVNVGYKRKSWYVLLQEAGTKDRTLKGRGKYRKGTKRGRIKGNGFITRSHNTVAPKVVQFVNNRYLRLVNNSIKKQLRKLRK